QGLEFEPLALDFDENFQLVGSGEIDFIYSNPAAYTCMAVEFGVQTVASLINFRKGNALGKFAGVIFTRWDSPFQTVEELRQARIEAVSLSGLGAMQLQQAELLEQGLDIMTDVPRITFAFNQNKIVQDVQNGDADVGFVRTDLIDRNVHNNLTRWEYFKVIGEKTDGSSFPFARSTDFTPEWPIGALTHVPDEIREQVGRALMSLDRFSSDPALSEPALQGNFASWTSPNNYFGLLEILQRVRYFDPNQGKCLRSSDEYTAIYCPPGYVKKARDQVFCPDCKEGYSCLCSPCAKLRDPEFVLQAELLSTSWKGNVDVEKLENRTFLADSCQRMATCVRVIAGQKLKLVLLDQIGADSRAKINAPLVDTVRFRMTNTELPKDATVQTAFVEGLSTEQYIFDTVVQGSGTQVIQIDINGAPAAMSPVIFEVEDPPLQEISCPVGHEASEEGACIVCPPGTVSLGGTAKCRPCDPGTMQAMAGQGNCEACSVGEFQPSSNAVGCLPCARGTSSRGKTGSRDCSPCEPGQEAPFNGSDRCTACKRGFYSEVEGSATCVPCSGGKGTTDQGSTSPSMCVCLAERRPVRDAAGFESCVDCGNGLSCPGQSQSYQKEGFWVDVMDEQRMTLGVYRCRNDLECPEGPLGTCAPGREGRACNNCMPWHRKGNKGACHPCEGLDILPLVWVSLGMFVLSCLAFFFIQTNLARLRLGQVTVFLTAGQVIMLMQLMAAVKNLNLAWTGPAIAVVEALSFLAFDINFMNLGCVVSADGAVLTFAWQLMAFPVFSVSMCTVWWLLGKGGRRPLRLADAFNVNGLILMTLFVTLTIVSLLPWQCISNPNGTFSMQTQPGVICFQSDEHFLLLIMSAVGIMMYPVPMLAVAIHATVMYPSYVSSGKGLLVVNRYRFIFERFRAKRYFFGVLYLFRNTFLAVIPVALASYPSLQICSLASVMLVGMIVQVKCWPWRTEVANYTDMLFSCAVMLFLVFAGPVLDFETDEDKGAYANFLSWSFVIVLGFALVTATTVAFVYVTRRLNPKKAYRIFLSHHKSAAGSLARFIKCIMNKHSPDKVFLDSDELQDLDSLFECVRSSVSWVVVLITPAVATRPWCIGELCTAYVNNVQICCVACDGACLLRSHRAQAMVNAWTSDQFQPLLAAGINEQVIESTLAHLNSLRHIPFTRLSSMENQETSILDIMKCCEMKRRHFVESGTSSQTARVIILTHTQAVEALSTSMILQMFLQQTLQEGVLAPRHREQLRTAFAKAEVVIILLHEGMLVDPEFAGMMLNIQEEDGMDGSASASVGVSLSMGKSLSNGSDRATRRPQLWQSLVTVSADSSFTFPGHEFYSSLAAQGLGSGSEFEHDGPKLCDAYKTIFKKIALPLSAHASESLIVHQVKEISQRVASVLDGGGLMGKTLTDRIRERRNSQHSSGSQSQSKRPAQLDWLSPRSDLEESRSLDILPEFGPIPSMDSSLFQTGASVPEEGVCADATSLQGLDDETPGALGALFMEEQLERHRF
ncbi:unnamed protein product, partial [Effrenium voratum]